METKKLLNIFNKKINTWLLDLEQMDENLISIKPSENSWSMAELYDHVMRVGRSYQIPNLKQSITASAKTKKRKNLTGLAIFNLGVRKNIKMRMENFPAPLVEAFTPEKRSKSDLIKDFKLFIEEVNDLKEILNNSTKKNKQYHPMFGDITTKEWFALIELHIWQHDKQKKSIKDFLMSHI